MDRATRPRGRGARAVAGASLRARRSRQTPANLAREPAPREAPASLHGARRETEIRRDLLHAVTTEDAQLDQTRELRVRGGQRLERFVERHQLGVARALGDLRVLRLTAAAAAAASGP